MEGSNQPFSSRKTSKSNRYQINKYQTKLNLYSTRACSSIKAIVNMQANSEEKHCIKALYFYLPENMQLLQTQGKNSKSNISPHNLEKHEDYRLIFYFPSSTFQCKTQNRQVKTTKRVYICLKISWMFIKSYKCTPEHSFNFINHTCSRLVCT